MTSISDSTLNSRLLKKGIENFHAYLAKQNSKSKAPFYEYIQKSGLEIEGQDEKLVEIYDDFKRGLEDQVPHLAHQLKRLKPFQFDTLDRIVNYDLKFPVTEQSLDEFCSKFRNLSKTEKADVFELLSTSSLYQPYLEVLRKDYSGSFYLFLKGKLKIIEQLYSNSSKAIQNTENEHDWDLQIRKLYQKFSKSHRKEHFWKDVLVLRAIQIWKSDFKLSVEQSGRFSKTILRDLNILDANGKVVESTTAFESVEQIENVLRFYSKKRLTELDASSLKKEKGLLSSPLLSRLDLTSQYDPNVCLTDQWAAQTSLERLAIFVLFQLIDEKAISIDQNLLDKKQLSDLFLMKDFDKILQVIPEESFSLWEERVKQRVLSLYSNTFVDPVPSDLSIFQLYLKFQTGWRILYGRIKKELEEHPSLSVLAEEAYLHEDNLLLGTIGSELSLRIIPMREVETLTPKDKIYKTLEKSISANKRKDMEEIFLKRCLGNDRKSVDFGSYEKYIQIFKDFTVKPSFVSAFFENCGIISADEQLNISDSTYDQAVVIRTYKALLIHLIKKEAKEMSVRINSSSLKSWEGVNEVLGRVLKEKLKKLRIPLDLDNLKNRKEILDAWQEIGLEISPPDPLSDRSNSWPWLDLDLCPNVKMLIDKFCPQLFPQRSTEEMFFDRVSSLGIIIDALKKNQIEQKRTSANLDELLEQGNVKEIEEELICIISEEINRANQNNPVEKIKGSLKLKIDKLFYIGDSPAFEFDVSKFFEEQGFSWIVNSSRAYALGSFHAINHTVVNHIKLFRTFSGIRFFYQMCLSEIERLNFPSIYKRLLDLAVSYRNFEACDWIFQKLAMAKYQKFIEESELDHLIPLNSSDWTIQNAIKKTKEMIKKESSISSYLKEHFLWCFGTFPACLWMDEEVSENRISLSSKIQDYLNNPNSVPENIRYFARYLRVFKIRNSIKDILTSRVEFIDKRILEIQESGQKWKEWLISELEMTSIEDLEKLDQITHLIKTCDTPEDFIFKCIEFKNIDILFKFMKLENISKSDFVSFFLSQKRSFQKDFIQMIAFSGVHSSYLEKVLASDSNLRRLVFEVLEEIVAGIQDEKSSDLVFTFFSKHLLSFRESSTHSSFNQSSLSEGFETNKKRNSFVYKCIDQWISSIPDSKCFEILDPLWLSDLTSSAIELIQQIRSFKSADLASLNGESSSLVYQRYLNSLDRGTSLFQQSKSLYASFLKKQISLDDLFSKTLKIVSEKEEQHPLSVEIQKATEITEQDLEKCFPWKPLQDTNSILSREVERIGLNRKGGNVLQQYHDAKLYLKEVFRRLDPEIKRFLNYPVKVEQKELQIKICSLNTLFECYKKKGSPDLLSAIIELFFGLKSETSTDALEGIRRKIFGGSPFFGKQYDIYKQQEIQKGRELLAFDQISQNLNLSSIYRRLFTLATKVNNFEVKDWILNILLETKYKTLKEEKISNFKDLSIHEKLEVLKQELPPNDPDLDHFTVFPLNI